MAIHVPIVMLGLRLFIVVLQELQNCLHVMLLVQVLFVYTFKFSR